MNTVTSQLEASVAQAHADAERSLKRYARELGVSLDHVILASLQMVAHDYMAAQQQPVSAESHPAIFYMDTAENSGAKPFDAEFPTFGLSN